MNARRTIPPEVRRVQFEASDPRISAWVAANAGSGNYHLGSKFTAHDIPACSFAQALDLNGGFADQNFKIPNPMYFLP